MPYCDDCCEMAPCLQCQDELEQAALADVQEANDEANAEMADYFAYLEQERARQPLPVLAADEIPW